MNSRVRSAVIAIAVVVLDRITKLGILHNFSSADVYPVIPGIFNIVHAENPGAAFSMLADASPIIRKLVLIGLSTAVLAIVGMLLWRAPDSPSGIRGSLMRTGLTLVFGGALGNLIDRIFRGTVTDFIQVFIGSYEFPSFNVADSAITIGAGLLVIDLMRNRKSA
ncbi:MAG TPA: signal peptidase II [Bryobacteraceae bacterium]|nr:signal peptidase II [Bryobacteraceae bacterium]